MTPAQFHRLQPGDKVLAFTGGHQHVAVVHDVDHGRMVAWIKFYLRDGHVRRDFRSITAMQPCERSCSPGPVERRVSPAIVREWLMDASMEVRR